VEAQGTLVRLPVGEDSALLASLLTLSDAFCTGHRCAVRAGVGPRTTVTVIGDGAVRLSAVLAARRLGAERILLMRATRHAPSWAASSVPPRWSPSAAPRASNGSGSSPAATAPTGCWSASAPGRRWGRRSGWPTTAAWSVGTVSLDQVPDGYRAMADREALKVLIPP
jgi:hypothetical protein